MERRCTVADCGVDVKEVRDGETMYSGGLQGRC